MGVTDFNVTPGSRLTFVVKVVNQGAAEDYYELAIIGIPAAWVSVLTPVLRLGPGLAQECVLVIRPPAAWQTQVGIYPFTIRATSQLAPDRSAELPCNLTIAAYAATGRISIFMPATNYSVEPGDSVEITLVLANRGITDDYLSLSLSGISASWVATPSGLNHLGPGEQREVTLTIRPPRLPQNLAGRKPFKLVLRSQEAPEEVYEIPCTLTVRAFSQVKGTLQPQSLLSGQSAILTLSNQGNVQEALTITFESQGDELLFEAAQAHYNSAPSGQSIDSGGNIYTPAISAQVRLPAGRTVALEFRAKPRTPRLLGGDVRHPFAAQVQLAGKTIQTLAGELVTQALIQESFIPAAMALAALLLICVCIATFAFSYSYIQKKNNTASLTQTVPGAQNTAMLTQTASANQTAVANQVAQAVIAQLIHSLTATAMSQVPIPPTATPVGMFPVPSTATPVGMFPVPPSPFPSPLPPRPTSTLNLNQTALPPSTKGLIAFVSTRNGNQEIFLFNLATSALSQLTNAPGLDTQPAISPNGQQIAFTSNRTGNNEIYVMNIDGANLVNLTNNPSDDQYPAWSPNGAQIAFASNRNGNSEIYVMQANGSGVQNLTNNPADDTQPTWFTNQGLFVSSGNWIAFTSNRDGNQEIYLMNSNGSNPTNLTNNPASDYYPAGIHSGTQIAFTSNRNGNLEIYVMDTMGKKLNDLTNNPAQDQMPTWSLDDKYIAFASDRNGNWDIYTMQSNGKNQYDLIAHPAEDLFPSWH